MSTETTRNPIRRSAASSYGESIYTALETVIEAERLNLVPITTPAASLESNGMAEAFYGELSSPQAGLLHPILHVIR